ncbi:MAG: zinc ribbon domain-containing protein [Oscillospiraceae bacterium]|jgi:hypothetical protein|nr:zinc ribbon domain-containing protein [Oscillospiraceae bacterium]
MMYCIKCGNQLKAGDMFCVNCGALTQGGSAPPERSEKRARPAALIVIFAAVILIAAAAALLRLKPWNTAKNEPPAVSEDGGGKLPGKPKKPTPPPEITAEPTPPPTPKPTPQTPPPPATAEPPAAPARENLAPAMTDEDARLLNVFFSNFSEVHFGDFSAARYDDADLIVFAIWHAYRNNTNALTPVGTGELKISQTTVENSVEKYFGVTGVRHQSVGNAYRYADGGYYFYGADGDPLSWSQVEEFYDNGDGTFDAVVHVYASHRPPENLYERIANWIHYFDGADPYEGEELYDYGFARATVAPHSYGGKQTYKLLEYRAI